jgi:hypothetical protein
MSMQRYALIDTEELVVIKTRLYNSETEQVPVLQPSKMAKWVPVVRVNDVPFDETTHKKDPVPEETVTLTEVTWTFNIRPWNQDEVTELYLKRIEQIKAEAQRRIYEIMPLHKQLNAAGAYVAAQTEFGADPTSWPTEKQTELQATLAKYVQVKAIRDRSDQLEAGLPEDAAGLNAFDPSAGWD